MIRRSPTVQWQQSVEHYNCCQTPYEGHPPTESVAVRLDWLMRQAVREPPCSLLERSIVWKYALDWVRGGIDVRAPREKLDEFCKQVTHVVGIPMVVEDAFEGLGYVPEYLSETPQD